MTRLSAPTAYAVLALFGLFALSGCDDAPGMCPDGDDSCNADAGAEPDGGPGPEVDCAGAPGGSATVDMCGVCDDDPANDCAMDCAGEWGGDAIADSCGVCDDDPTNDCVEDCAGVLDGDAAVDARTFESAYSYDPNGNLSSVTDPFGRVTTYAYDAQGRRTGRTQDDLSDGSIDGRLSIAVTSSTGSPCTRSAGASQVVVRS